MKTEQEIAKENVERTFELKNKWLIDKTDDRWFVHRGVCISHKQTCQRWLEFLNPAPNIVLGEWEVKNKIKDLKQAIKIYNDTGI